MRSVVAAAAGALLAVSLAACSGSTAPAPASASVAATLTVSAASSLTEAFTEIADLFEEQHPGVTVSLNFAGSSALAEQVNAGAPVDVLATASKATMDTVVEAGNAADPETFATNELTVAVPSGNPAGVGELDDLSRSGVRTAICAPEVPCGAATATLLTNSGLTIDVATLDPDVKSVLGRVTSGEVDAGIVYVTDVRSAGDAVTQVEIPSDVNVSTDYLISPIADAPQPAVAADFVAFVVGPDGQQVLRDLGFGTP